MQCSECDSALDIKEVAGLKFKLCDNCNALWISASDIVFTMDYLAGHPELPSKLFQPNVETGTENNTGYCPDCNEIVKPVNVHNPDFTFLKCVGCNGIWIGHQNLEKMIQWWHQNKRRGENFIFANKEKPGFIEQGEILKSYTGWMEDDNPLNRIPYMTVILILLNIVGFFMFDPNIVDSNSKYMFTPSHFLNDPGQYYYTIFTSIFMHANIQHLLFNMIFLFMFGNNVEDRIGPYKFILLYLFVGVSSSIIFAFVSVHKDIPALGASGAIAGILGAYLLLYPKVTIKQSRSFFFYPYALNIPAWIYLGIWFPLQQLVGIALDIPGIGWHVHLAGFILGYLIMLTMRKLNFL